MRWPNNAVSAATSRFSVYCRPRHTACGLAAREIYYAMARIPLEDNFNDVINKAQRGWKISDEDLAKRAEVSLEDLAAVKAGKPIDDVIRRVARHLKLSPAALEVLAHKRWYPQLP